MDDVNLKSAWFDINEMKMAMDDIAELLYNETVDKETLADIILPFVSKNHLVNVAVLASRLI